MKRKTKAITLTMLAGWTLALTGCWDDGEKPKLMKSEDECSKQFNDSEGCHKAAEQARQDFEKQAPRFEDKNDCDSQFGAANCHVVHEQGHDFFLPAMTGFLIGKMVSDGSSQYRVQPTCANGGNLYSNGCGPVAATAHPVYVSGYNPALYNYAGRYSSVGYEPSQAFSSSWTSNKVAASRVSSAPVGEGAVARGGFGGSAVGEAAVGE